MVTIGLISAILFVGTEHQKCWVVVRSMIMEWIFGLLPAPCTNLLLEERFSMYVFSTDAMSDIALTFLHMIVCGGLT